MKKFKLNKKLKNFLAINIGVILISIAFVFVMTPNNAVYGGVQGISIVINFLFPKFERASYVLLILNVILLILGLIFVSKEFFIKTLYGSIACFVYAWLFEWFLTDEVLKISTDLFKDNGFLIVTFSSILLGTGLGIALKAGASTGGVDILQAIFYKHFKLSYSKSLIFIDGTIVIVGSLLVHSGTMLVENILYALVVILLSGYIMDAIVFSGFNVRAMYIITKEPEKVKNFILEKLSRGVTVINAVGGYTGEAKTMLLCVLSSREYFVLKDVIETIDENAFIYAARASEVHGEGFTYDTFNQ